MVASHLAIKIPKTETARSPSRSGSKAMGFMEAEISVLRSRSASARVKRQMEKTQREYYLNEQMKAIRRSSAKAKTAATRLPRSKSASRRRSSRRKPARRLTLS
jgi:ATP-dependent Lon protease